MKKRPRESPTTAHDSSFLERRPHSTKKPKLHATAESPFPAYLRPTAIEAREVYRILDKEHPGYATSRRSPLSAQLGQTSSSVTTVNGGTMVNDARDRDTTTTAILGDVPDVLESLVSVILSQNTTGKNSAAAKAALDARFGRNEFAAIAGAPYEDVVDAIRQGGLANKKARVIQNMLREVKEKYGRYSLQHLAAAPAAAAGHIGTKGGESGEANSSSSGGVMTDEEVMSELMAFDGVGPKTASCVLLFCLGRDSFAVDTHVFRLCMLLGWVPPNANRVSAQLHLEKRVPDELKYGLHVLMVQHGRVCKGCKSSSSSSSSRESCVLKMYVRQQDLR